MTASAVRSRTSCRTQTAYGSQSSGPTSAYTRLVALVAPMVKMISDSGWVAGRRGISAEYSPNDRMALANNTSPLLNRMPASAPTSPRSRMVSTPASEIAMPAICATLRDQAPAAFTTTSHA